MSNIYILKYSDFDNGTVTVSRQYQHKKIVPPKSANSYRSIPLHPIVVSELSEHRERQRAEMSRYHYKTDYVFTTHTGRLLDYSDVRRSLDRLYHSIEKDAETGCFVPHKFHAFRATFCTNLRRSGVSLETACALMGHSSVQVTADYYSAVTGADLRDAIMGQDIKFIQ